MKHLLVAVYIFSVLYCYLQLNTLLDRAIDLFRERHPSLPLDEPIGWKGLKLTLELLLLSAIPILNLWFGYFFSTLDDSMIQEIITNVEMNHWMEIKTFEDSTEELLESDRQEPAVTDN